MKIGFSSSVYPDWDLATMVQQARTLGYEALELCLPRDRSGSTACPALNDPAGVKTLLGESGIELACLATDLSLYSPDRRLAEEHHKQLRQAVETAEKLGCPCVTIKTGSVPRFHNRDKVLLRIVDTLREASAHATEHRVIILVENDGNLAASRDLWFILDAADSPSVACCWNPCQSVAAGENAGLAVPRIGSKIMVTHMADAVFAAGGIIDRHVPLGEGEADLGRYLVLMLGIGSSSRLIVKSSAQAGSTDAGEMLSASLAWIKGRLESIAAAPELTAYKGDKNAPRYAAGTS